MIGFRLLNAFARHPKRSTEGSAGFDLHATETGVVRDGHITEFCTGVTAQIAPGWAGFIEPRSGLARRHGVTVLGGVIDRDYYPNEIVVLLTSVLAGGELYVNKGDRIAQIVFRPIYEGSEAEGQRTGGFGSTGNA